MVVKPTAPSYEPIAEYHVADNQAWIHPIFLGDPLVITVRPHHSRLKLPYALHLDGQPLAR